MSVPAAQRMTHILNNLNILNRALLQLKELRSLHEMLQLESSFWHLMALAPFLKPMKKNCVSYRLQLVYDLKRRTL